MAWNHSSRRGARRLRVLALGCLPALVAMLLTSAAPAAATVTDRDRFTNSFTFESWDCGYQMDVVGTSTDLVHTRVDAKTGNTFFSDVSSGQQTWTRSSDGRFFTVTWNQVFKDVQAKPLGGNLWEFTNQFVGQPVVISDSSGTVVSRDRGNLTQTFIVDVENGEVVDFRFKSAAPHPLFFEELCHAVRTLTGSNSYQYLTAHPIGSTTFAMGFYDYLPPSYTTSGPASPVLIALNGYGENGDGTPSGLPLLLQQGIPRFIDIGGWPTDRPLAVLALQHVEEPGFDYSPCDNVDWGGSCVLQLQDARGDQQPAPCTTADEAHAFISYVLSHYNVDPHRVYLTGLSCGGFGAWEYLAEYGNQQVAAAVPASGEGRPAWSNAGCALGSVPIWAFAGALDDVVHPDGSIVPMTNLQGCGLPPDQTKLTVYDDFGHDAWNPAYDGQEGDDIYAWMLGFTNP